MIGRFPRDRPVRESRMPENMRKQPHRGNGEGVDLHPLPYPLIGSGFAKYELKRRKICSSYSSVLSITKRQLLLAIRTTANP